MSNDPDPKNCTQLCILVMYWVENNEHSHLFFLLQVETRYLGFVNGYSVSPNMLVKHTICFNIRRRSVEDTVDIETLVVNHLYVTPKDLGDTL